MRSEGVFITDETVIAVRPEMTTMTDCRYCGCEVEAHDPVFVSESSPDAEPHPYCNYACLVQHVEQEGLMTGTSCNWEPADE